jgi:KaiC/GvpD/RAD55 family RecA-like ATPase
MVFNWDVKGLLLDFQLLTPYHTDPMASVLPLNTLATPATKGFFSLADLENEVVEHVPDLVQDLIGRGTVNLLVGDTGLGKTALGMQLGMCVAGGVAFLDMPTQQGNVLYVDAESSKEGFKEIAFNLRTYLELPKETPFFSYSQLWDFRETRPLFWQAAMEEVIAEVKPSLVIVDPLRAVWERAEKGPEEAVGMINWLRKISKQYGCAWLITHHIRKVNRDVEPVDLLKDPQQWFQEAAGSRAIITGVDTRIGVASGNELCPVVMRGYMRLRGALAPKKLERAFDENGTAMGYLLTALPDLSKKALEVFKTLPSVFRLSDVKSHFNGASRTSQEFLEQCIHHGLVIRDASTKLFHKV